MRLFDFVVAIVVVVDVMTVIMTRFAASRMDS